MIAVDPGVKGAMAYDVGNGPVATVWGGVDKMHDELTTALSVLLLQSKQPTVYLEHVTSSPIMSKKSAFTFGHNFGQWETLFYCFNVRVELVKPQMWQRGIPGLAGKTGNVRKLALKAQAVRLFPQLRITKDNADALLILNYAQKQ